MKNQFTPTLQMVDHYRNNQPLTLADLDNDQDDSPLDSLIQKMAGPFCKKIEFVDDKTVDGWRRLYYQVTTPVYTGRIDTDENGKYADSDDAKEIVWVPVAPDMGIRFIAMQVMVQVRSIENNVFTTL
ncbi:hypothetical protein [uncultured Spirosoma sp.]|mgnify:CR=1 FL=1|nr:hypothetical protein [uncultured Spirosoma sp.]